MFQGISGWVLFWRSYTRYKEAIKLIEASANQSVEWQDTYSALFAAVCLIVVDGDTLQHGSCVNYGSHWLCIKKRARTCVLIKPFSHVKMICNIARMVVFFLHVEYVREKALNLLPTFGSQGSSCIQAPGAWRWLWVSHWLQSFKQSKTGKTRQGFYTWLAFVSVQQQLKPAEVEAVAVRTRVQVKWIKWTQRN